MNQLDHDNSRRIEAARESFFSTGKQYYVSGRYAVLARLIPVAGNLLHHAVEMFLKGGLVSSMEMAELRTLGHNLPNTWNVFKVRVGREGLDGFDPVVASLHAFEELRYPDSIIERGARMVVGVSGPSILATPEQIIPTPSYELYLSDVDPLVGAIFGAASVNPAFFTAGLSNHAREFLKDSNVNPWAG